MRRSSKATILFLLGALALGGCKKQQDENATKPVAMNDDVAANADIEALPADESSATPSDQLESGDDNADVNDLGNGGNSE